MSSKIPQHIALIPDGNRRWAKDKGLSTYEGHKKGVESFRAAVRHAADRGVKSITLWGMSIDNFTKRNPKEILDLISIFQDEFESMLTDSEIHDRKIRVRVFGRWREKFPKKLQRSIDAVQDATADYEGYNMNLLLAYNGTDEMLQAIRGIIDDGEKPVTPETIKRHLFTKDLPPVDLVIRTGGEPHLSNGFMMWDTADAELCFTELFWPDFTKQALDEALADYSARRRMRGE